MATSKNLGGQQNKQTKDYPKICEGTRVLDMMTQTSPDTTSARHLAEMPEKLFRLLLNIEGLDT